jgi:hypothetical protein
MNLLSMRTSLIALLLLTSGCALPQVAHRPVVRNPFPELARVAIAPFFNLSTEPTVDGRQFALAYYNELQLVPGFEVVPVGVVEAKMQEYRLSLGSPRDARQLAQLLGVDAVVVGAVTDFTPYYPPRCGLRIEWYSAHPCFHNIPAGYGLPLDSPQAESIPEPLIFETEMAMARAQLKPPPAPQPTLVPVPDVETLPAPTPDANSPAAALAAAVAVDAAQAAQTAQLELPPPAATLAAPPCRESLDPVLRHTRTYNGHDLHFTQLLKEYAWFQNDARFGGWQSYLQRSDDFIRFCCHLHISEMLTARGGAGQTQVVWRWPKSR